MCDILKRIHNAVSIVIARIDTPFVSSMRVWSKLKVESIDTIRYHCLLGNLSNQTNITGPEKIVMPGYLTQKHLVVCLP